MGWGDHHLQAYDSDIGRSREFTAEELQKARGRSLEPEESLIWTKVDEITHQRDLLAVALGRLCRELQCPAMEYLHKDIKNAWSDAFNLLKRLEQQNGLG